MALSSHLLPPPPCLPFLPHPLLLFIDCCLPPLPSLLPLPLPLQRFSLWCCHSHGCGCQCYLCSRCHHICHFCRTRCCLLLIVVFPSRFSLLQLPPPPPHFSHCRCGRQPPLLLSPPPLPLVSLMPCDRCFRRWCGIISLWSHHGHELLQRLKGQF